MKIAIVLLFGLLGLVPVAALAQSAASAGADKPTHPNSAKMPRPAAQGPSRSVADTDRAVDAELKRIDRMMTICTGC